MFQPIPKPNYVYDATKELADMIFFGQLMEFLMELYDMFGHIRYQILLMEPLLSINKALFMVTRVEKPMGEENNSIA